ncbi:XrtN system VIT domain-containing protein [Chitinophaga vietnamensis]|uniref:XrtN system VIT domain-containing protein n=1 Tax=Chitinophaga vietnamensis TaxID=2593957 RepID=UPI0011780864|nr:XrtN system VIT domain-containing protein [Chitinophaga vietnamensis]
MESTVSKPDSIWWIGLGLLLMAFGVFCTGVIVSDEFSLFLAVHIFTGIYLVIYLASGKWRRGRGGITHLSLLLGMLMIDAWLMNREMKVFDTPVPWFTIMNVLICVNAILLPFSGQWPQWIRILLSIVTGLSVSLLCYLSIFLLPLYPLSVIGCILFLFSIVTFCPLFYLWLNVVAIKRFIWRDKYCRYACLGTIAAAALWTGIFSIGYVIDKNGMERIYSMPVNNQQMSVPAWVPVAQRMPSGRMAELVLKCGITYSAPVADFGELDWVPKRYNEKRMHDPLLMIAAFFGGRSIINEEDRIRLLEVMYDKRHQATEQLWSGDGLHTTDVQTRAEVWPDQHVAYTERTISVRNNSEGWSNTGEALYTFYLPPGATVTSLSLWINGKEEKALLTTKDTAVKAYTQIVRRERRDPAVVHWQEGNRVTLRVFPVTRGEAERKFRIGITSPLQLDNNQLVYQPGWFEGPDWHGAPERVKVMLASTPQYISLPYGFGRTNNEIDYSGSYSNDWELRFSNEKPPRGTFTFSGQRYSILSYQPAFEHFIPDEVYLDISNNWTYAAYTTLLQALGKKPAYVFHPVKGKTLISADNKQQLFDELHRNRFSLFPFQLLLSPEKSLVITSSGKYAPQLSDLDSSQFRNDVRAFFSQRRVRVFDLAARPSPYLAALWDTRSLIYDSGDLRALLAQMSQGIFLRLQDNATEVTLPAAGISIVQTADTTLPACTAPDHLARLFAFNHVMQQLGPKATDDHPAFDPALLAEAQQANVVSPVSSLIVLETQQDYEHFNISESINSLKNAALRGHGAVPEPHEWALFIVALCFLGYVRYGKLIIKKEA